MNAKGRLLCNRSVNEKIKVETVIIAYQISKKHNMMLHNYTIQNKIQFLSPDPLGKLQHDLMSGNYMDKLLQGLDKGASSDILMIVKCFIETKSKAICFILMNQEMSVRPRGSTGTYTQG